MPKSGYLPDISGNFSRFRVEYREGMDSGKWAKAALALHHMNGALDDEYRLPISNEMWMEQQDGYIVWECLECTSPQKVIRNKGEEDEEEEIIQVPTRSKKEEIRIFEEKCNDVISFLSGRKSRRMWECPKCHAIAPVRSVRSKLLKYPAPHYRGCIYEEPEAPKTGLMMRRGSYPTAMRKWTKLFSIELEHQLTIYRLEYIRRNGEDMEDAQGYKDKGGD